MVSFMDLLVVAGFFLVRVGIPVLFMAGMIYGLKRLDRRWEAEAREQQRAQASVQPAAEQPAPQPPAQKPGRVVRVPGPQSQLPWVPPPAPGKPGPGINEEAHHDKLH